MVYNFTVPGDQRDKVWDHPLIDEFLQAGADFCQSFGGKTYLLGSGRR
jgi:hypothetical protein